MKYPTKIPNVSDNYQSITLPTQKNQSITSTVSYEKFEHSLADVLTLEREGDHSGRELEHGNLSILHSSVKKELKLKRIYSSC